MKILLPINFPYLAQRIVHQAAFLARQLDAEILLLHVVTPLSYPYAILERGHYLTERDLHSDLMVRAQRELERATLPELDGIAVERLLLKGEPSIEIARIAREEKVNLIAMSTHGRSALQRFLLGSVAAKVLHDSDCPVWTDTHLEEVRKYVFSIRNILCAIDLSGHSHYTITQAAQIAAHFEARLTLVHITATVEGYGPGGPHVIPAFKEALVSYATTEIAKIQKESHTTAEVIIDSGNVHDMLQRTAERAKSDLLVIGHLLPGHLGANGGGYSIIRGSQIPVLSV